MQQNIKPQNIFHLNFHSLYNIGVTKKKNENRQKQTVVFQRG